MNTDHDQSVDWPRLLAWFERVVEAAPAQRAALLDAAATESPALRAHLERLLALDASSHDISANAADWRERLLDDNAPPPHQIGPWRIVRELGAGGMGRVYLAERAEGDYEQRVALKCIASDVASDAGVWHFLRERRILARLEHRGITRLIDGGVGAHGQPWFAMEYVEGEPLSEYCDSHRLELESRLRLFMAICDAVAYAHRQLIVHCDLKPDNILVDGNGQPRLLDFGIAHLLRGDTGDAATTQLLGRRLTPGYAAPEQLAGEPVGVATDVYALGVLLYELLTGARPYLGRDATPAAAMHAQATDAVLLPSRARIAQLRVPRKHLRGDLDLIVATALRHQPMQRYPSVDALGDDLRRHLSGLPLRAHAPSRRYRAGRFIQRHRIGLALSALLVLVCAAGVFGILREAAVARAQAQRATAVKNFLIDVFNNADPNRHPGVEVSARELLEAAAKRLQHDTHTLAPVAAEIADTLSQNFAAIGANTQAAAAAKRALALHIQVSGAHSLAAARARIHVAQDLYLQAQDTQAQEQLHLALADLGNEVSPDAVHAHLLLAQLARQHTHADVQMKQVQQAVALAQRLPADKAYWRGTAQYSYAMALMARSQFKASAAALARATAQFRGVQSLAAARKAQYMHAVLLMHTREPQQAATLLADLVKRERATLGNAHPQLAQALQTQAEALMLLDRDIDAKRMALESVAVAKRSGETGTPLAQLLQSNALIVLTQGDLPTTRALVAQAQSLPHQTSEAQKAAGMMALLSVRALRGEAGAVTALRTAYDASAPHTFNGQELDRISSVIGHGYLALGDLGHAHAWIQQVAHAKASSKYAQNKVQLAVLQALVALQSGELKQAQNSADAALTANKHGDMLKNITPFLHLLQGLIATRMGAAKTGLAEIEPALSVMQRSRGEASVWTANAHLAHAEALAALGRNKQAAAESASAWRVLQRMLDPNHIELRRHRLILSTWW